MNNRKVILEQLTVAQLVKKLPECYEKRKFVTEFKTSPYLSQF
jgi:hypothetical protein